MSTRARFHSVACGKSPAVDCDCVCDGALHGWRGGQRAPFLARTKTWTKEHKDDLVAAAREPAERAGAANSDTYATASESEAVTAYLVTKVATWTVTESWPNDQRAEILDFYKDALRPVNRALLEALGKQTGLPERRRQTLQNAIEAGHAVCMLCVSVLRLYGQYENLLEDLAQTVAEVVASELFDAQLSPVARAAVEAVLRAGTQHIVKLTVDPNAVVALRFAGALFCPDWSRHPDRGIWDECIAPHFSDALEDAEEEWAQQQLKRLFR